jgi:hypothetical protein
LRKDLHEAMQATFGRARKLIPLLGRISARREPTFLPDILTLLWDKNAEVVFETCATIAVLILKIPPADLPTFDSQLRARWLCWSGMGSLDGSQLERLQQSPTWWGSFAILGSHPSGFVRQAAVEQLAKDETGEALPFLLLRASDWVEQVRAAARDAIEPKLKNVRPATWAKCLPLAFRMRGMLRHQPKDLLDEVEMLCAGQPEFLKTNFAADHLSAFLRYRYRLAKVYTPIPLRSLITAALEQSQVGVRLLACDWVMEDAEGANREAFAQALLEDKAPMVRARAFWKIASARPEAYAAQIEEGLMDRSEAVQDLARGVWRLLLHRDALAFYQQRAATAKRSAEIIPVVRGLRAEGTGADEALIRPLLQHPLTKVRREGLKTLVAWNVSDKGALLIEGVQSKLPSYAKECSRLLAKNPGLISSSLIQRLLDSTDRFEARQIALRLAVKMSKWASLPLILQAYSILACRDRAEAAIRIWYRDFNRNQTAPSKQEAEDAIREFGSLADTPIAKHRDLAALISSLREN